MIFLLENFEIRNTLTRKPIFIFSGNEPSSRQMAGANWDGSGGAVETQQDISRAKGRQI